MLRVLFLKKTESEWLNVMHTEFASVTQQESDILPILKLRYDHLPSHLKHCFAYCVLFPKDYVINKQILINLWMAQGFIQSSTEDQQLEDVGHEYFMDLVWRSFFQEVHQEDMGNVKSCKMHDLMHDLAWSVAGTVECIKRAGHISFNYELDSSWKIPGALLEANKIRTFFLPAQSYGELNESNCNAIVSTYKCLRALDLHSLQLKKVPRSIGKLKHLRNIDLSRNDKIRELPSSISRLHNLQTLKLSGCEMLVELPSDIRKMVGLRHLINDDCKGLSRMPEGLGQLTSLRTLSLFVVGKTCRGSGGLRELNGLNTLRGDLKIINLKNGTSSESRDAKYLEEKLYLQSLKLMWSNQCSDDENILKWSHERSERDPCYDDEVILEGLEPHPNLKQLHVEGFWGVKFFDWLSSLTNIVKIKLENCERSKHLPALDQLPSLRILHLERLSDLEKMAIEESSTSITTTFFPSLKELYIGNCDNLKGWWKNWWRNYLILKRWWKKDDGHSDDSTSMAELPSFPCLSKLMIHNCPNLIFMPLYPSLEEELYLYKTSSMPLQETMKMMMNSAAPSTSSSSSSSSYPLSRLKYLRIKDVEDLEYLPEEGLRNLTSLQFLEISSCPRLMSLPAAGFRGLTSLRILKISFCHSLTSLCVVFQHLTALKKLWIYYCRRLDLSLDSMQCQGLKSLSSLAIGGFPQLVSLPKVLQHLTALEELNILNCDELDLSDAGIRFIDSRRLRILTLSSIPKLLSLPDWLQHATTLQKIQISCCANFTTLPEWMGNLKSLQKLEITLCPNLTSLPQGMHRLTALQRLEITVCPQLSERCSNNNGEDWHKIAHIPNIEIERQEIQVQGRYQGDMNDSSTASTVEACGHFNLSTATK